MRSIHGFTAATSTFGSGRFDRAGAPLRVEERQLVELAVVVERLAAEPGEASLHGQHIVTQAWTGVLEFDAVPANDVGASPAYRARVGTLRPMLPAAPTRSVR